VDGESENLTELSAQFLPLLTAVEVRTEPAPATTWRAQAQRLQKEAHVFYFVFKHRHTRWYVRLIAGCTAAYLFSPIQIIPNYIPVIGMLDDVLVVFLGVKLLRKLTPAHLLAECRELADAAQMRRKEKIRSSAAVAASITIATVWLLAAVIASVLMAEYIRH
jgi:uncharacterized membrane protein YkvA (DUF1232 family)